MRDRPLHPVRRRPPLLSALLAALFVMLAASRGTAAEVVAVLSSDAPPYAAAADGLTRGLSGRQSVRTITIKDADLRSLAGTGAQLVAIGGPAAARFLAELPADAPFYYCMVSDPAAIGLHTDKRSRGITTEVPLSRQIRLMKEAAPDARRIGALHDSRNAASAAAAASLRAALEPAHELVLIDVAGHASVARAIEELLARRIDLIWTSPDSAVYDATVLRAVLLAGVRAGVPVFGFSVPMVKAGALAGTGIDPGDQGLELADVIVAGDRQPPGPRPPRVRIAVNTLVAEKLHKPLPRAVINAADHVYPEGER